MTDGIYMCPICKCELRSEGKALVCEHSHSFDLARRGYVNLLRTSKPLHGDNAEMVAARCAFLATESYSHLANAVCELLVRHAGAAPCVLDIGCGEGYYTERIANAVYPHNGTVYAFDISKDAVKLAARRTDRIEACVASVSSMPYLDEAFDAEVCIFSPLCMSEYIRVLKRGGILIMAIPSEYHLFELKEKLYDNPYKNVVADTALDGFELVERHEISRLLHLNGEDITNLFKMTPYYYRTRSEDKAKIFSLSELEVSADFTILVYKKK